MLPVRCPHLPCDGLALRERAGLWDGVVAWHLSAWRRAQASSTQSGALTSKSRLRRKTGGGGKATVQKAVLSDKSSQFSRGGLWAQAQPPRSIRHWVWASLGSNRRPHWSCSSPLWYPSAAWVFKVPKLKPGRAGWTWRFERALL